MTTPRVWPVNEPPIEHAKNALALIMALESLNTKGYHVEVAELGAIRERLERIVAQLEAADREVERMLDSEALRLGGIL